MPKGEYANFIRKSDEFYRSAEAAIGRRDWSAGVSHAVHATISMADALTVFYLGERSAVQDHRTSGELLRAVKLEAAEFERNRRHVSALIDVKDAAEYQGRLFQEEEAKAALEHSRRFLQWARAKLPP